MGGICIARQPIVNINEQLEAYEILYKASEDQMLSERQASISVVNALLNKFGTREVLSEHKAFIKVDKKFLMSDLIKTIPVDFFTLSICQTIDICEKVSERVDQLNQLGFCIGVHNVDLSGNCFEKYKNIFDKLSYMKINANFTFEDENKAMMRELQNQNIKIIATNIETLEQYEKAKQMEFDLYQGYWFAKPKLIQGESFNPEQFNVLKIYNMLLDDASIDEITAEFEKNHALSLQLLRFINSAAFHFRQKISSIHQILMLVGRKPLSQWLMLTIYSKSVSKGGQIPPIILMAKNRTELMQNLLKAIKPDVRSNALGEAYLVGVLSLMGTAFGVKLEEVLENIHVTDLTKDALLHDKGSLGMLYKLVRDIEDFKVENIMKFCEKYKVAQEQVQSVILKSIEDVNLFEKELQIH